MPKRNGLLANYIPAPADPSQGAGTAPPLGLLGYAENLSMGGGRGVRNQLAGLLSMAQNPRQTVNALYQMGTTPSQWAPMVDNALRDTSRNALSGPLGFGQVAGEMLPLGPRRTPTRAMVAPVAREVSLVKKRGMDLADVKATLANLPPVPEGHTRVFKGSSETTKFSDVFNADALAGNKRPASLKGQFWTDDLKYADYYRSSYGRDAKVHYADVPTESLADKSLSPGEYILDIPK